MAIGSTTSEGSHTTELRKLISMMEEVFGQKSANIDQQAPSSPATSSRPGPTPTRSRTDLGFRAGVSVRRGRCGGSPSGISPSAKPGRSVMTQALHGHRRSRFHRFARDRCTARPGLRVVGVRQLLAPAVTRSNLEGSGRTTGAGEDRLRVVRPASVTDPAPFSEAVDGVDGVRPPGRGAVGGAQRRGAGRAATSTTSRARSTCSTWRADARGCGWSTPGSSSAYGDIVGLRSLKHEELREAAVALRREQAGRVSCTPGRSAVELYGSTIVVTRFFNVYGPRQVPDSPYSGVVAAFCFALLKANGSAAAGRRRRRPDARFHVRR